MKRFVLVLCLLLATAANAGEVVTTLIDNSGTDQAVTVATTACQSVIVLVSATEGSPDGTVSGTLLGPKGEPIAVFSYATPTTAKAYRGPALSRLQVILSGNSTGKVTVTSVCK